MPANGRARASTRSLLRRPPPNWKAKLAKRLTFTHPKSLAPFAPKFRNRPKQKAINEYIRAMLSNLEIDYSLRFSNTKVNSVLLNEGEALLSASSQNGRARNRSICSHDLAKKEMPENSCCAER
jgi:hypothetical protein